ncbi:hypothetical protein H6G06_16795 [Anabaena sphaerica FACHB-251]|uniref:Uncharacterized protein n=1 Tax=Anabaena sphaerica FACHB-251 TaxID=2692883 RepID=A0A926WIJ8_9NOST|nr:TrbI/VirB10 family protein [Anabaena sphaerica]MBD2295092.1 hypothetical protein [Anabaena sphaerica FACHB-251]
MENINQNQEFNSHNGNSTNYSLESNTNNGHHRSIQTTIEDEEIISPEEEQMLAGYNPNATGLISQEYRLKQDEEKAIERPLTEKPGVRLVFVVGLVGMVIGSGSLLWFGFLQPKPPVKQAVKTNNSLPTSEPNLDESAELKSRLAFQDQQQQLQVEPVPTTSPSQTPKPEPITNPSVRPVRQTVPPRTTAVRVAQPAPVIRRNPVPTPFNSRIKYTPPPTQKSIEKLVETPENLADVLRKWKQLSSLGESQISKSIQEKTTPTNQNSKTLKPSTSMLEETELKTVLIGSKNVDNQTDLTPGMMGILNRTPVDLINANTSNNKDVALGTSASAKVIMPMIWDEGGKNANDRFAVELTKPLKATDGTVAFPAGTVVVAKTTSVSKSNLVSATAIALVYPNSQGTVKQETIPANTLLIRGGNKRPLLAQKLHDAGSDIAKQDLLVGLLSSLGRVGSIVNQPRTQSSTVVSGGSFNQSTVTTNADPQIWAAVLEGFFDPLSDRLSRRSDQAVQELLQRPNIQYLPEGMEVSVVVNNFLKVER